MSDGTVVRHLTAAEKACMYLAHRLLDDRRLAYLIGPGSQSWELLTAAVADVTGCDLATYRSELSTLIRPVRIVEADPS